MSEEEIVAILGGALVSTGALVGFSIGLFSLLGYRSTRSPTLLRLCLGFLLVGTSFPLRAWGSTLPPDARQAVATTSGIIEVLGYFMLVFSHIIKARHSVLPKWLGVFFVQLEGLASLLTAVSVYLLVHGAFETFISFLKTRRRTALITTTALVLLAGGELLSWESLFLGGATIFMVASHLVKVLGLLFLLTPVVAFVSKGETHRP